MTFLDSHTCLKSMRKVKRNQQKSWASKSESHEIWQAKTKQSSEQQSLLCHEVPLENGEFLHLGPENCDFAIYSNIYFLNNFLLKSQNNVSLVLGSLLRSVVYDSAFNSNFPFLVTFGILSPNCVINANYGFKRFAQYLYVLQTSEANQKIINKHRLFVKLFSLVHSNFLLFVDSGKPFEDSSFITRN